MSVERLSLDSNSSRVTRQSLAAMKRPRSRLVTPPAVMLLLLVSSVAACRGRTAGPSASVMTDACGLLTQADAEALLGGPVTPPQTGSTAAPGTVSSTRCSYLSASGSPVKVVTLLLRRYASPAAAADAYERALAMSRSISGAEPADEAGPSLGGQRAYWAGGTVNQLNVLRDDAWLIIGSSLGPGLDQRSSSRAVAARILTPR
ncbi:MAG TPA: hypothetical protein VHQ90_05385 [Thermoanaerobaculia bacterium]|nr:hypothetical protein [Thermoanaerobaculia bacterium]